jgi:hypothetical protein
MYTLYNTSVELDARLATAPQPVFHYNIIPASLAIDSSSPKIPRLKLPATPRIPTTPWIPTTTWIPPTLGSNSELRGI